VGGGGKNASSRVFLEKDVCFFGTFLMFASVKLHFCQSSFVSLTFFFSLCLLVIVCFVWFFFVDQS